MFLFVFLCISLEGVSCILAAVGLGVGVGSTVYENKRKKKDATIQAFNYLQKNTLNGLNFFIKDAAKTDEGKVIVGEGGIKIGDKKWNKVTGYLADIEHFAVGVRTGIYNLDVVELLCGGYLSKVFDELSLIIIEKRKWHFSESESYVEFEALADKLRERREEAKKEKKKKEKKEKKKQEKKVKRETRAKRKRTSKEGENNDLNSDDAIRKENEPERAKESGDFRIAQKTSAKKNNNADASFTRVQAVSITSNRKCKKKNDFFDETS